MRFRFDNAVYWVFLSLVPVLLTGCPQGTAPMNSVANPQTLVRIRPMENEVDVFSNDGRSVRADEIKFKDFYAKNLAITERSVENRDANSGQIGASMPYLLAQQETLNRLIATAGGVLRQGAVAPETSFGFNPATGQGTFTRGATPIVPPEPYTPTPVFVAPPTSGGTLTPGGLTSPPVAPDANPSPTTQPAAPPSFTVSTDELRAVLAALRVRRSELPATSQPTSEEMRLDEAIDAISRELSRRGG